MQRQRNSWQKDIVGNSPHTDTCTSTEQTCPDKPVPPGCWGRHQQLLFQPQQLQLRLQCRQRSNLEIVLWCFTKNSHHLSLWEPVLVWADNRSPAVRHHSVFLCTCQMIQHKMKCSYLSLNLPMLLLRLKRQTGFLTVFKSFRHLEPCLNLWIFFFQMPYFATWCDQKEQGSYQDKQYLWQNDPDLASLFHNDSHEAVFKPKEQNILTFPLTDELPFDITLVTLGITPRPISFHVDAILIGCPIWLPFLEVPVCSWWEETEVLACFISS